MSMPNLDLSGLLWQILGRRHHQPMAILGALQKPSLAACFGHAKNKPLTLRPDIAYAEIRKDWLRGGMNRSRKSYNSLSNSSQQLRLVGICSE